MNRKLFALITLAVLGIVVLAGCNKPDHSTKAEIPVDKGYAEGKEIYYTHTEVSNADMAAKMGEAMESPVLYVPSLASVPEDSLANVYAFTNGVKGGSMSGFQPSVFDNPPGTEGYTPLRRLNMVAWANEATPRTLKSASDILEAADTGELTIAQPGVVINMPFITWDGERR